MSSALLAPVWSHLSEFQPVRGEGVYLYDAAGTRMMDFTSGIGVTNTGHCHPKVVAAIKEQADKLLFAQMNCVIGPRTLELADTLNELTPPGLNTFFFSNSGAEATEAALKLARHATRRTNVVVFQGSFHGRTAQTVAMTTSKTVYRHRYHPLPSGVFVAPFPYSYAYGWDEEEAVRFCLAGLEHLLKTQSAPDETACFIIEPVLGEGGYVPAPVSFLRGLRELADRHGILLIIDEVQTGFGRTGKFFCFEYAHGVEPDIIVMAKGLGSGMPISGVASSRELMSRWEVGTHGGTYGGGNAVVMAAARAGVSAILEEDLCGNAYRLGEHLRARLRELQLEHPAIGDVRGLGLMVATEFSRDGKPDPESCAQVHRAMLEEGTLLLTCGTYNNVIRWIPPLVVTQEQLDEALTQFRGALERLKVDY